MKVIISCVLLFYLIPSDGLARFWLDCVEFVDWDTDVVVFANNDISLIASIDLKLSIGLFENLLLKEEGKLLKNEKRK
jgi:hypothetical protein